MAPNSALRERFTSDQSSDPRESGGAQIIDLATRNVLPSVTQRKKADGLGLAAGVAIVALLGGLTLWSMDAARNPETKQAVNPVATAPVVPQAAITPVQAPTIVSPNAPVAPLAAPAPQAVLSAQPGTILAPQGNPAASPTVVFDAAGAPATTADLAGKSDIKAGGNPNDDFASRLGAMGGGSASAKRSFDPATTVTQGTLIPAVLETAIDTDVPGFVRAIVSSDVKSFDGRTVLVPRSSRLIGQYKSGLSAGQKRAYVIWTRLIRPDGVSVDLGSPAIAFGGETGLAGKVNGHFFERFGSAMLLSVLGGIPSLIGNNSSVVVGGGSSAASTAVQQGGQVGPTIRVRQGEPIRVFTAKDLDFSKTA
ncbi:TrbI/VirB10 family protein [Novosphingobium sp. 9U]|uniref:TrbI/VirB10 family protein n=1 Tax=Novosphingobium sp. 9U TaxID=2653158 RepID=UPI0012F32506|nr:TrbI/VirB10 family protein [Novosphingobium sp. 9U]VWX54780.1 Inner membrane protein forms channel for type IV secretion of T-DNA complex (VirB10) [Novosphingobium sp. 9U]